jgi:hypothetical protein
MIKRADASKIGKDKATKEQIAENFKRLAIDSSKKVELKPSLLKVQKTLDGKTFGIIHENKSYYLKYTTKNGSTNPVDFKHLDGLNSNFSIEKHNSFQKAVNKMSFICEAQNNVHKLRMLNEADENIIGDTEEKPKKKVTSDDTEEKLLGSLDKEKTPAAAPAADMGGEMPTDTTAAAEAPAADMPVDTSAKGESPAVVASGILDNMNKPEPTDATAPAAAAAPAAPAADMGGEEPAAEEPAAEEPAATEEPAAEEDPKKEFQEAVGKLVQITTKLRKDGDLKPEDIKNLINSSISAVGREGFKEVGDDVVDSFVKKMRGSEEKIKVDNTEEPAEEEEPIEEPSTEKLDENFLRSLKKEAKQLLKEQLGQEIIKRKRSILIENIKRKLI